MRKSKVANAIAIVNLINASAPGVASLILAVRGKNGKISIIQVLDETDEDFKETIESALEWKANHPEG